MYEGKRVVVVTPAGRKKYLELLVPQIVALRPIVDEYRLWVNTPKQTDIEYMESLEDDFIKLERLQNEDVDGTNSIRFFFRNCCDPDTIYVRFDDDIISIDRANFNKLIEFRIKNPEYFLVYGNILNNCIVTHLQQRLGNIPAIKGRLAEYDYKGDFGWRNAEFAEELHRYILEHSFEKFRFPGKWILNEYEHMSINCISWLGEGFDGIVECDEEKCLSVEKPNRLKRPNCIFGEFVCIHFAFHTQREHLDQTDILSRYREHPVYSVHL